MPRLHGSSAARAEPGLTASPDRAADERPLAVNELYLGQQRRIDDIFFVLTVFAVKLGNRAVAIFALAENGMRRRDRFEHDAPVDPAVVASGVRPGDRELPRPRHAASLRLVLASPCAAIKQQRRSEVIRCRE
jgi:hypothetical protein